MEELRMWAFGLCSAAVAGGMMELLLPRAGLRRVMKAAVSVFLLGCIFAPVGMERIVLDELFSIETEGQAEILAETERLSLSWSEMQGTYIQGTIKGQAETFLVNQGLTAEKIVIGNHVDEDGRIHISECEIWLTSPPEDAGSLRLLLEQQLGVPVSIRVN